VTVATAAERSISATTQRAMAFVEAHRPAAIELGRRLADLVGNPDEFSEELHAGFRALADPEYQAGQHFVGPGLGRTFGVRNPLLSATARAMRRASVGTSPTLLLFVVERLLGDERLEPRWFAFHLLDETLARDPARTWQQLRRAAREAADWITVDALAHPVARGILREPLRWAEIEQLTLSQSVWERRLVASTIATMPFADRKAGRTQDYVERATALLAALIGDAEPDVQKALAWAYRSVAGVDQVAATTALEHEARTAIATGDGNRAWVIRDAASKLDAATGTTLKHQLAGIRREPGAASTSTAAELRRRFAGDSDSDVHSTAPTATKQTNVR
jgi:3-methyladenine DNA glycosylase AlkD